MADIEMIPAKGINEKPLSSSGMTQVAVSYTRISEIAGAASELAAKSRIAFGRFDSRRDPILQ